MRRQGGGGGRRGGGRRGGGGPRGGGGGGRPPVEAPQRYCSRCGQQMEVVRAVPGEPSWRALFRCANPECQDSR